mgnify:CR=1 FL=1
MRVLILNGPNLNLLGTREVEKYGLASLDEIERSLVQEGEELGVEVVCVQTDHEGSLIHEIHEARGLFDGIVLNPGGLAHSSVALLDAVLAVSIPVVEVHITNTQARESFRRGSLVARGVWGRLEGMGPLGYRWALKALVEHLKTRIKH